LGEETITPLLQNEKTLKIYLKVSWSCNQAGRIAWRTLVL